MKLGIKIKGRRRGIRIIWIGLVLASVALVGSHPLLAQEIRKFKGWEKSSPYDRLYKAKELEKIRVTVVGIKEVIPMEGMSPGVALEVKESIEEKEVIQVHLCPKNFLDEKGIGIKPGDKLKIRGAWAEIKGKDFFMAAKIKRGDYFQLKLRLTKDGTPLWTLSPEERKLSAE